MTRNQKIVRILFALGMISIGGLLLAYGYEVLLFLPPAPAWIPALKWVGYASVIITLGTGAGLIFDRTARASIRVLLPFLLLWTLSRVPVTVLDPGREISWFAIGEVAVLAAGAIVLFVWLSESRAGWERGLRMAQILFGLSLVTYGLSHFFEFAARTVSLVPPWLPYRTAWADLAGAGQIAAGLGVVFSVLPRVAAAAEASMLSVFTLLVWIPAVITKPSLPSNWVEFLFTFALAGASWVVTESIPTKTAGNLDQRGSDSEQGRPRELSSLSS
jgi:uncharacterized membrane protein YphA (DoxX/SURF4 family)